MWLSYPESSKERLEMGSDSLSGRKQSTAQESCHALNLKEVSLVPEMAVLRYMFYIPTQAG